MKQMKVMASLLATLSTSSVVLADCSTAVLGGDPLGVFTQITAFNAVNDNPPQALFVLSDLTKKGAVLPAGPGAAFLVGTPFNDYQFAPNGSLAAGLNGGFDIMLLADPAQAKPGFNEVDVMESGNEVNGGQRGSLFILGDAKKRYYAGKNGVFDIDRDYAYINRFIPGSSKIRLKGTANDYRQTLISGLFSQAIAGTAIVTKDTCDVVGFVRGVTRVASTDFEYAVAPSATTAVSGASQAVTGVDQFGGPGATTWFGPTSATDLAGNVYMVLGSSSASLHGVGGTGSYYLVKYDANGTRLWTRKHGTNPGTTTTTGIQAPLSIVTYGSNVYVSGLTWGPYGGGKPSKLFGIADGVTAFIAKFDASGNLSTVAQKKPTPATTSNPSWAMAVDNAGDLYFGGSFIEGISIPMASAYVMKVKGSTLATDTSFGNNGAVIFRNGPPTVFQSLNLLADAFNNFQITNFSAGLKFAPDGSGAPGSGSVYVAGVSDNGSFFGSQPGWNDVWYTKLNATNGTKRWSGNYVCDIQNGCGSTGGYSLSAPGADSFLWGIDVDAAGNLYLGGETGGTFSNVGHAESLVSTKGTKLGTGDGFVAQIDTSGVLKWLKHVGTASSDNIRAIKVDGSSVYVTGETRGVIAGTKKGQTDIYAARLSTANGTLAKTLQLGSERFDVPAGLTASSSKLYISGFSEGSVAKPSDGSVDAFLINVNKANF